MAEQKGGCCIARYAAGGAYDTSNKMDRIMLKFRPIAPKPASLSGGGSSGSTTPEISSPSSFKTGRGKRRRAAAANKDSKTDKVNKRSCRCSSRKRKSSPENTSSGGSVSGGGGVKVVNKTLSFLPEAPNMKMTSPLKQICSPLWLSFENGGKGGNLGLGRRVVVGSWVKVERVTDTWVVDNNNGYDYYGRTDEERLKRLDIDTCPGFVTDGQNRVRWTNAAYRRMMAAGDVEVVVEEGVALPVGCAGFTCRVRVVTCGKDNKGMACQTAPCDVWRMDCGGFAWRVDTTAALSLGR